MINRNLNPGVTYMRITVEIDVNLMARARELTGIEKDVDLLNKGLREMIQREAARRLAALGGSAPDMEPARRRRSRPN